MKGGGHTKKPEQGPSSTAPTRYVRVPSSGGSQELQRTGIRANLQALSFTSRFARIGESRFAELDRALGNRRYSGGLGVLRGNRRMAKPPSVLAVGDPYLLPVTLPDPERAPTQPQRQHVCIGMSRQDAEGGLLQCRNVVQPVIGPPDGPQGDTSRGFAADDSGHKAWMGPFIVHLRCERRSREKHPARGTETTKLSICLAHARMLFALPLHREGTSDNNNNNKGKDKPESQPWMPHVCAMYDRWANGGNAHRCIPYRTYVRESGELIRYAAAQASADLFSSPKDTTTPSPDILSAAVMDFDAETRTPNSLGNDGRASSGASSAVERCVLATCVTLLDGAILICVPIYECCCSVVAACTWSRTDGAVSVYHSPPPPPPQTRRGPGRLRRWWHLLGGGSDAEALLSDDDSMGRGRDHAYSALPTGTLPTPFDTEAYFRSVDPGGDRDEDDEPSQLGTAMEVLPMREDGLQDASCRFATDDPEHAY